MLVWWISGHNSFAWSSLGLVSADSLLVFCITSISISTLIFFFFKDDQVLNGSTVYQFCFACSLAENGSAPFENRTKPLGVSAHVRVHLHLSAEVQVTVLKMTSPHTPYFSSCRSSLATSRLSRSLRSCKKLRTAWVIWRKRELTWRESSAAVRKVGKERADSSCCSYYCLLGSLCFFLKNIWPRLWAFLSAGHSDPASFICSK